MGPNVRPAVAAVLVGMLLLAGAGCAPKSGEKVQKEPQEAAGTVYGTAGKIHVDDGGAGGVPVLFVHALAGNNGHWAGTLAHLRTTRRALAFDLRGHGQSAAPAPGGYAVDSLASDIAAVADQLGLERFVLVGHSLGGAAASAYVGAHPERVAGLVLVSSPGPSPPATAQRIIGQMEANDDSTMQGFWESLLTNATAETRARIQAEKSSLSKETSFELIRAIFSLDPMPALRAYPGPVLIVDTDADDGPTSIHRLAPALPHRVIAGTSHWLQLDKPAEFDAILDEFLARVDARVGTVAPGAPGDTL